MNLIIKYLLCIIIFTSTTSYADDVEVKNSSNIVPQINTIIRIIKLDLKNNAKNIINYSKKLFFLLLPICFFLGLMNKIFSDDIREILGESLKIVVISGCIYFLLLNAETLTFEITDSFSSMVSQEETTDLGLIINDGLNTLLTIIKHTPEPGYYELASLIFLGEDGLAYLSSVSQVIFMALVIFIIFILIFLINLYYLIRVYCIAYIGIIFIPFGVYSKTKNITIYYFKYLITSGIAVGVSIFLTKFFNKTVLTLVKFTDGKNSLITMQILSYMLVLILLYLILLERIPPFISNLILFPTGDNSLIDYSPYKKLIKIKK